MTAQIQSVGSLEPFVFNLADDSDRTIVTASNATQFQIESILVASPAADTFTLWVTAGGDDVVLLFEVAVDVGEPIQLTQHPLRLKPGWVLKCKAGTGPMSVTASLLMISKNLDKPATL